MRQDSVCCVIGEILFIMKTGMCQGYTLTFHSAKAALAYARLCRMDLMKAEAFIAFCEGS